MIQVRHLRVEGAAQPLGLHTAQPRITWQYLGEDELPSVQVDVMRDGQPVWSSGPLEPGTVRVAAALTPRSRDRFVARVSTGGTILAETTFEYGLLTPEDWHATWIASDRIGGARSGAPAPRLTRTFRVDGDPQRARLYVTAAGLFEVTLNGKPVSGDALMPGWTDYATRIRYATYDVTDLLKSGDNELVAHLGDGWFVGHIGWRHRQNYGDRPALLAQLEYATDRGTDRVVTDGTWDVTDSHIVFNDLLMGEHHDLRRTAGTSKPQPVTLVSPNVGEVVPFATPRVQVTEVLRPTEIRRINAWPKPLYVLDFGQNLVGRMTAKLSGRAGDVIRFRFAEILDEKKNVYTANLRSAQQTDYVTLSGGSDIFAPKFTFHGFRYVEVQGLDHEPQPEDFAAEVLHSAFDRAGEFECSHPLLTQLWKNISWGWRGNAVDVPTDCPQRDERLGWTGDAQVFIRTALTLSDSATFFEKYVQDLADAQTVRGSIPPVAPDVEVLGDADGGPAWAEAFVICPWTVYHTTGDDALLRRHRDAYHRFYDYLAETAHDDIRMDARHRGFRGFGDWLSINADTPHDVIGTAFYARTAWLLAEIESILGDEARAQAYRDAFVRIRSAFQRRFVTADGLVASGTQTAYVLALHFDLLEDRHRPVAVQALVDDIARRGYKLSTGFVGSPYLNHVLTEGGRLDIAYRLLFQREWPSWLYAVTQGATTIWERWDGWTHDKGFQDVGMNSFNHYAYGAIGDWMMQRLAGIDLAAPGFRRVRLAPVLPTRADAEDRIEWVRATQPTPFGNITSAWRLSPASGADGSAGETWEWNVTLPPGTEAVVDIPWLRGDVPTTLPAGSHTLRGQVVRPD
ncbi:MAG: family 78 glycoside hydrolase catalytic domain [Fimbriimonadaceae bacterium]|nr:family 78 glycoside hydrolase catalytic domain [Fimbriimonadaceae bacterium]